MRRYDEEMLNKLLDRYENSLLYTGKNQRSQTISVPVTKRLWPEYFDPGNLQFKDIHAQLMEMEQKGYISLVWKNNKAGHILEKCVLHTGRADEIYDFLHRRPKMEKETRILKVCSEYAGKHPLIDHFLEWVQERIQEGKSVRQYVDTDQPEQFSERCRLVLAILTNTEEIFWREFSIRFWKDSKVAEKELPMAVSIIKHFSKEEERLHNLETEQVLEEFGIYKNPSWVMMKGCGHFYIEETKEETDDQQNRINQNKGNEIKKRAKPQKREDEDGITLEHFPGGIGLSSTDILQIQWDGAHSPKRVLTIENLTSFHRFQEEGTLVIYLGGYHNKVKRQFLRKLYENLEKIEAGNDAVATENTETGEATKIKKNTGNTDTKTIESTGIWYEHFGDIDCGGFQIWKDLREKTGIPFRTRQMDEETYLAHLQYGKPLTERDKKALKQMMEDQYFEEQRNLFSLMLEKGKKLEQECVM